MANVPYSAVPTDVSPQATPTPSLRINEPPAAFGGVVGQALEGLGAQAMHSANEIFARAEAIQNLRNETEAKEADANYMMKTGELHAQFSALQGKQAVDAYPGYIKSMQDSRTELRDGLSNDAARKMYDSASLSTMGRTIFNGAGHAAAENKKWALTTSNSRIGGWADQAREMPKDDVAFKRAINGMNSEIESQGQLLGQDDETVNRNRQLGESKLWSERIIGLSRTDPFAAKKMLEENRDKVKGLDIEKVDKTVQGQIYTTGARNIAHQVNSGSDGVLGSKPVSIEQAKVAIGTFESGNNYSAIGVQTKHGRALGRFQVMEEFLPDYLKQAGMPPMTAQEFIKDHAAQDQLFSTVFGANMAKHGSFNDAASIWFSGKPMAEAGGVRDANGTSVPTYVAQTNAILAKNAPLADRVQRGVEQAKQIAPDDPMMEEYTTKEVEATYNRQQAIRRNDQFEARQAVETALMGDAQGKLPTTLDELKADPKAEAAWNTLDASQQRKYLGVLANNSKEDKGWSEDRLRNYQKLKGMSQGDPAEFLGHDVIAEDLPNSAKRELINLQVRLKANSEADPRVTKALGQLQTDMFNAGITKSQDKERYYQFVGALQDALTDFQGDSRRQPTQKDIQTIGSRLLQEQTTHKGWLWDSKSSTFEVPVPEGDAETIKSDPAWAQLGITPTDQMVQRVYARKLYQKLYGGSSTAKPDVGMSK